MAYRACDFVAQSRKELCNGIAQLGFGRTRITIPADAQRVIISEMHMTEGLPFSQDLRVRVLDVPKTPVAELMIMAYCCLP